MKVCTLIGISFSHIYISVEAINELLKYLVELMLLMEKLVSAQSQSVNTPTEQIPNFVAFLSIIIPHPKTPLQSNSGLLSGSN
jgi:hypothetical protein